MMPHPLVAALEDAFQEVRDRDLTLGERLKYIADCVRTKGPGFAAAVDAFVSRLEAAQAGSTAPMVGDIMPDFCLPDHEGRLVTLQSLLERGPAVLAFHRGHWCPYCRLNMVGLAEIEAAARPAQIVAISSEIQHYTRILRAEAGAQFPFLTDVGGGYALSINLAIWVDEAMAGMIGGAGWDIPGYQGGTPWVLPVPAVFVVRQDGIIAARHVDPDYRRRMELDALLDAVKLVRD
ncbi:peroxiredoxin [Sphingomonas psychrolutea]|uniref:Peroxiredoxin n=2 Tax=Sphingomonas psychrolutea TaxID=1259676 RepID=A0ABQ1H7Q0_9SPHN|nr:peroxiredoxin [Sphingomonas psychrolutea]